MTAFTHRDNRTFTHRGSYLHTTKDGREVILQVWEARCLYPGCTRSVTTMTATMEPWDWPRFAPPKYCTSHRSEARRRASTKASQTLQAWRESPAGRAALEARQEHYLGTVERVLYDTIQAAGLTDDAVPWFTVLSQACEALPAPTTGRDTRKQRILRALESLQAKGRVHYRDGVLTLLR